jgi:hypothetical protein
LQPRQFIAGATGPTKAKRHATQLFLKAMELAIFDAIRGVGFGAVRDVPHHRAQERASGRNEKLAGGALAELLLGLIKPPAALPLVGGEAEAETGAWRAVAALPRQIRCCRRTGPAPNIRRRATIPIPASPTAPLELLPGFW